MNPDRVREPIKFKRRVHPIGPPGPQHDTAGLRIRCGRPNPFGSGDGGAPGAPSTAKAKVLSVLGSADVDAAAGRGSSSTSGGVIVWDDDRLDRYIEEEAVGAVLPDDGARFDDVVVNDLLFFVSDNLGEVVNVLFGRPPGTWSDRS